MLSEHILLAIGAISIDWLFGDPQWIWQRVKHPVVWLGHLISFLDFHLNRGSRKKQRIGGYLACIVMVAVAFTVGTLLTQVFERLATLGFLLEILVASIFIAQKSLYDHVFRVFQALMNLNIEAARQAVSLIVSRDTKNLSEEDICRAAIESLAENYSDGVVAPLFWLILFGLPGLIVYKMINTADSMIGYKNEKYEKFGFASARLDDVLNLMPARFSSLITFITTFVFMGYRQAKCVWQVVKEDANHHRSPNAGWPESAFAGALKIQLAGPRIYDGMRVDEPFINARGKPAQRSDIPLALRLYTNSLILCTFSLIIVLLMQQASTT